MYKSARLLDSSGGTRRDCDGECLPLGLPSFILLGLIGASNAVDSLVTRVPIGRGSAMKAVSFPLATGVLDGAS